MKFLIIGLGSMGKRRVRNLQAISAGTILGVDLLPDRRREVEKTYGIQTFDSLKNVPIDSVDAIIVSTPPAAHDFGIQFAIDHKKPVFVEASVVLGTLVRLNALANKKRVLVCPSCTMRFHPAIKIIKQLVQGGTYGDITNFSYHMGQYLPDWHPWEKLTDTYTSKKETGGAREMVAFEFTWITDIIGYPQIVRGVYGKTFPMGIDIDDTYAISVRSGRILGTAIFDVVARYATRRLVLNMQLGQILWSWDEPLVRIYDAKQRVWKKKLFPLGTSARGYNKNITEDMYIEEMKAFIAAIKRKKTFPNTLADDILVLKLIQTVERNM